jgi:hypothetical protein
MDIGKLDLTSREKNPSSNPRDRKRAKFIIAHLLNHPAGILINPDITLFFSVGKMDDPAIQFPASIHGPYIIEGVLDRKRIRGRGRILVEIIQGVNNTSFDVQIPEDVLDHIIFEIAAFHGICFDRSHTISNGLNAGLRLIKCHDKTHITLHMHFMHIDRAEEKIRNGSVRGKASNRHLPRSCERNAPGRRVDADDLIIYPFIFYISRGIRPERHVEVVRWPDLVLADNLITGFDDRLRMTCNKNDHQKVCQNYFHVPAICGQTTPSATLSPTYSIISPKNSMHSTCVPSQGAHFPIR